MDGAPLDNTFRELIGIAMKSGLGYGGLLTAICGLQWMSGDKYSSKQRIIDIFVGYGITCSSYTVMALMQKIGTSLGASIK